jgi:restriction system protein
MILFTLGIALFVASTILARNPMLAPLAQVLRGAAPWSSFIGALLLILYLVLRKGGVPPIHKMAEPIAFGQSTSTFREPVDSRPPRHPIEPLSAAAAHMPATTWSERVFEDIEWRRFEAVCESLFSQAGFEARSQSHGADGGVDIWLHSRNASGPAAVVQCKHWRKPVGVKEIREFFGVMSSHGLKRGTFATSSTFTADALRFAKDNGISALDRGGLLRLIATRDAEQQRQLLRVAYEGEYWRPTCASCGIKMVERTPRGGGQKFWGCAQFPDCRSTLPMRS